MRNYSKNSIKRLQYSHTIREIADIYDSSRVEKQKWRQQEAQKGQLKT